MRRLLLMLLMLLTAVAAGAATPYFLDRSGVLWKGIAAPEGLVLTGEQDGQVVVRTVVPFAVGLAGTSDTEIQVAADELTGKVVVVWQRNWSSEVSEVILAVWQDGTWERIEHLTTDFSTQPRFPLIQLSEVSTAVADPDHPNDPAYATVVSDSFLNVVWWETGGSDPHATFAALRLSSNRGEVEPVVNHDLDEFASLGLSCAASTPPEVLQHPLFASQPARDRALVLFGSRHICVFQFLEVRYTLMPGSASRDNGVIAQRARHVPVFGIKRAFAIPIGLDLDGVRVIPGTNLNPVAYRVNGTSVEYVTATDTGWSPLRTLTVGEGLTLDQAIPLVENLAR